MVVRFWLHEKPEVNPRLFHEVLYHPEKNHMKSREKNTIFHIWFS